MRIGSLKKMKNSKLKEYLNTFPDNADVSVILANPSERKLYECVSVMLITDYEMPVFCIDVGKASDMDDEQVAACEEDERNAEYIKGQMEISDFPEVMP